MGTFDCQVIVHHLGTIIEGFFKFAAKVTVIHIKNA